MPHELQYRSIETALATWPRARRSRPLIVPNPAGDAAFREHIDQILARPLDRPSDLEALLRVHHPHAVVRRRELTDEELEVWYVYRDGHWIGGNE